MTKRFISYENGGTTTIASIADGHSILRRQGYWRGADYRNDDGVRVIEYWGSRRAARLEQNCPSPAYIAVEDGRVYLGAGRWGHAAS